MNKIYRPLQDSTRVIWLLTSAVFINYVDRGSLPIAAPLIKIEFGLSNTQMGLLFSVFFWSYTFAQPVVGWIAQRFEVKFVYAIGFAIWSLVTALSGFAHGIVSLLMLRLALGLGESVTFPCTSKLLAESSSEHERGRANGLISAACGIGPSVGTLVGGLLISAYGWRAVFLVFGFGSLIWLWPWLSLAKSNRDQSTLESHGVRYSNILEQRALWGASLGHFCFNYGYYFVLTWLPLFLVNSRGFSLSAMSVVGGTVYGVFALSASLTGRASDRWIAGGQPVDRVRKAFVTTSMLGAACLMFLCSGATPMASALILMVVAFFLGLGSPQVFAIAQTLSGPRAGGQWMGLQNATANLSGIIAPVLTGWTVEVTGEYYMAFLLTGVVLIFGSLSWGVLVPRVAPICWDSPQSVSSDATATRASAGRYPAGE